MCRGQFMTANAENSTAVAIIVGRPFFKGVPGNPSGRRKGLASFTMDRTLNEDELVGFYIRVWKGENVSGIKRAMNSRQEAVYNSTGLHGCQADLRLGCRVSRGAPEDVYEPLIHHPRNRGSRVRILPGAPQRQVPTFVSAWIS